MAKRKMKLVKELIHVEGPKFKGIKREGGKITVGTIEGPSIKLGPYV